MKRIEWKEVDPEQKDWERQIDVMFCDVCKVGSIIYFGEDLGWGCIIDGQIDNLLAENEREAQKEMEEIIINHCDDEINYYRDIKEAVDQEL